MNIIFELDGWSDIGVAFANFMAQGRAEDMDLLVGLIRPHRHQRFQYRGIVFWLDQIDGHEGDTIKLMTLKEYNMMGDGG